MGGHLNFKSFGTDEGMGGGGGRPPGSYSLTRESSIYSLTFDEFQSAVGGVGKDFGSMNMDELLKNIWSAEENHNIGLNSTAGRGGSGRAGNGYLQKQGSLTLSRTLSQKTVDEVWRDMSKDYGVGKDASRGVNGFNMPPKQPTLGEVTLEEFLVKAGVVREETPLAVNPNNVGLFGDFSRVANSSVLGSQPQSMQQSHAQQPQQILPKQPNLAYGGPMGIPSNGQLSSAAIRGGIVAISDPATNNSMVQNTTLHGGGLGMVGLGANGSAVTTGSPVLSSDGLGKSNGDMSSVSPTPYAFNGGLRGRRTAALEKVVERRQRRMIKNRESAARSRARKQAYTTELEAEVAKLKEENKELEKKQAEMLEMQKNQVLEKMSQQNVNKKRCLRRTQTGPW